MNTFLWQTYHRLVSNLEHHIPRFLYESISLENRLTGIVGPRGVGKTTMMLQIIKNNLYSKNNTFYFSADNTFFNETSIIEYVDSLYQKEGIEYFFIDEIHKYKNWNQELKNIYDSYPKIKLFFSGSSSMDLIKGSYDLSRRAKLLHLPGLSFREYINLKLNLSIKKYEFTEVIETHMKIASDLAPIGPVLKLFNEYLRYGYYPTVLKEVPIDDLYQNLSQVIDKTINEDIANFYKLKTQNLNHFKRILNFLASIPPGEININNIAKKLSIDNKTVEHYIEILNKTGLVKLLMPEASGNQNLTKPVKFYLDNTTLHSTINAFLSSDTDIGTLRELFFLQHIQGAKLNAFYPKVGDFKVNDILFEVGGKNKTWKQLVNYNDKKALVKDDILVGSTNQIPLYIFGFLY